MLNLYSELAGVGKKRKTKSLATRFWDKVDRRGPDECWPWMSRRLPSGYGLIRAPAGSVGGYQYIRANRVSALLAGLDIAGKVVCHHCDNPPCVNPAHLYAGTQAENASDRELRSRGAHHDPSRSRKPKLSDEKVAEIRRRLAAGAMQVHLARELGVSPATINRIAKGEGWRHITASDGLDCTSRRPRRRLCRRGLHDLEDPANVIYRRGGWRLCRPCYAVAQKRWRPERSTSAGAAITGEQLEVGA